ncbi:MAG: alkylhydroperoxidase like protein AhpD family [Flavipsychrobacter sp.]|jgi:alkyl hydroperoxide reductase subunit D|nr:alkylhydroperoxidase like protein AhpD family [Flavipsychrobacter sp.]
MDSAITNETVASLFEDLGIDASYTSASLHSLAKVNSKYLRDLKLNVSTTLGSGNLSRKEAYLVALSVAVNEKNNVLIAAFETKARSEGASDEEIAETHACVSLMSANNIFYRFRHFMHLAEYYNRQPAGLRMSIMMNPTMGKGMFELMSLVLSAVNGCERCVTSHENSVKEHGADEPRVHDAIRIGAVIKSLCVVI